MPVLFNYSFLGGGVPSLRLGDIPAGGVVQVNEDGVPQPFKVAQQNYIQSGVTAIERVLCLIQTVAFNASNVNTYEGGTLDTWLTGTYRDGLDQNMRDALASVDIPVTPGNGNYTVTTISRDVFVFSGTEVGLSNSSLVIDGNKIDIYTDNVSRIKYSDNATTTARRHWTRSPNTSGNSYGISQTGTLSADSPINTAYVAPALALSSDTKVNPTPNPDGSYNLIL